MKLLSQVNRKIILHTRNQRLYMLQLLLVSMINEMEPSMAMGLRGILRESLKIPSRNGKLALSLALLLLIPYSLLFLANEFILRPFIVDLSFLLLNMPYQSHQYLESLKRIKADVGIIVGAESIFLLACFIGLLVPMVATIQASALLYAGKRLTPEKLFSMMIGRTWKKPVITWVYVTFLNTTVGLLLGVLIMDQFGDFGDEYLLTTVLVGVGVIVSSFLFIFPFFFGGVSLGLVISVVEEDCYGIAAIWKARKLMQGTRIQGSLLQWILMAVPLTIYTILIFKMGDVNRSEGIRLITALALINITGLATLYSCVAFTVFYYECKKRHGEEVEVQGSTGYIVEPMLQP